MEKPTECKPIPITGGDRFTEKAYEHCDRAKEFIRAYWEAYEPEEMPDELQQAIASLTDCKMAIADAKRAGVVQ